MCIYLIWNQKGRHQNVTCHQVRKMLACELCVYCQQSPWLHFESTSQMETSVPGSYIQMAKSLESRGQMMSVIPWGQQLPRRDSRWPLRSAHMTHIQPLALQSKVFLWPRPLDSLSYMSWRMLLRGTSWAKSGLEQMGADRKPALPTPPPEMLTSLNVQSNSPSKISRQ